MLFENFLADMGPTFKPELTLERKDNNGPYSPENCIWATQKTQANNTRTNRVIAAFGFSKTLSDWAKHYGLRPSQLHYRLKSGWPLEKALSPYRFTKWGLRRVQ